ERSAQYWDARAQAEREQKARENDRRWLIMMVPLWGSLGGGLSRMALALVFGSLISLPGTPKSLSALLNPAWHGFWGTWVGGMLVVWVLERWTADHARLSWREVAWFTLAGLAWGFFMFGSIWSAFRQTSLDELGWRVHQWGLPVTGAFWGLGLTAGI